MRESFIVEIQGENRVVIPKKVYEAMRLKRGQRIRVTVDTQILNI